MNKYIQSICSNDIFWLNRTIDKYGKYLGNANIIRNNYLKKRTWREYYKYLVTGLKYPIYPSFYSIAPYIPPGFKHLTTPAEKGYLDLIILYIEMAGVDPSVDDNLAIKKSSENGHENIVKYLIQKGVDPSIDDNYLIKIASLNGHLKVIEVLLNDQRVNPSDSLSLATQNNHLDVVDRILIDDRVNPATDNNHAVRAASYLGHLNILNRLLEDPQTNPSDLNNNALEAAIAEGHLKIVNRLLKDKRVNPNGNNPLKLALLYKKINIAKKLFQDHRVQDELIRTKNFDTVEKIINSL